MNFRRLKKGLGIAGMGAAILMSAEGHAFLAGVKATGMAATGVAYPQDAYAGAYNPAGILNVRNRFDISWDWIRDAGQARVRGNQFQVPGIPGFPVPKINGRYNEFRTHDVFNVDFGINQKFCATCGDYSLSCAVGFVAYNRDYQKTTLSRPLILIGTSKQGMEYAHEVFAPVFAFRINDCHTFGVSVDVHVQRLSQSGLENLDNINQTIAPGKFTNRHYDYSSGVGATIGWRWQALDSLSFGVTYRPQTKMSRFKKYEGFLAGHGRLNIPTKWSGGLAYRFLPCATLAFDVEWLDWKQIKSLRNPFVPSDPTARFGSKHGPGFGFCNQTFYRVGLDYQFNDCLTLRVGFRHANTFVRRSQTAPNLLDCDMVQDFVTCGFTYTVGCHLELSMFYAHGFRHEVKGKNSVPASFGGGEVDLAESKNALGISWGYIF